MIAPKGYVVRGIYTSTTRGAFAGISDVDGSTGADKRAANPFTTLDDAAERAIELRRFRWSDVAIFRVLDDGREERLPSYEEALKTVDAARELALTLAPWRYEGSIEGEGAADVVTAHRALCVALFGEIAPPITEDEQLLWDECRAQHRAAAEQAADPLAALEAAERRLLEAGGWREAKDGWVCPVRNLVWMRDRALAIERRRQAAKKGGA